MRPMIRRWRRQRTSTSADRSARDPIARSAPLAMADSKRSISPMGIGEQDEAATCVQDAGANRVALALILRQPDEPQFIELIGQARHQRSRAVHTPVVDDNRLDGCAASAKVG